MLQNPDSQNQSENLDQTNAEQAKYGYDMIISMKSLNDLKKGLKVQKFNPKFNFELEDTIIVGMQGARNKGKTFMLNSLINEDFPSDFHFSTPGICIKEHKIQNKKIVYIDSEGVGNPVSIDYKNNTHYQTFIHSKRRNQYDQQSQKDLDSDITNKHYDIKATEQIQQEFIIKNSNILIIVISMLTLEDQKLIHTISEKFVVDKNGQNQKRLIVVHNLKEYQRVEYMQDYIEQLRKNFPVKDLEIDAYESKKDELQKDQPHFNTIFYDEVRTHINHIVMGQKDSEAGKHFNPFALYYIKQLISSYQGLTNFNIKDKLQDHLIQNLQEYALIKHESQQTDDAKQNPDKKVLLEYSEKDQSIILKEGYKIEKIKELQVNIYGGLEKECAYSIVGLPQNKEIHLFVEIPGAAEFKRKFDRLSGKFILIINQKSEIEDKVGEILASTRKFEEKYCNIQICKEKELWTYCRDKDENMKNGIYKFVFTKDVEDDDF